MYIRYLAFINKVKLMKQKTYTTFGMLNIVRDMDLDVHVFDEKTTFIFDDRNERHSEITKVGDNEYVMGEWKPYTYANSIGV